MMRPLTSSSSDDGPRSPPPPPSSSSLLTVLWSGAALSFLMFGINDFSHHLQLLAAAAAATMTESDECGRERAFRGIPGKRRKKRFNYIHERRHHSLRRTANICILIDLVSSPSSSASVSFEIINFIGLDIPVAKTIQHNHLQCNSPVRDANAAPLAAPAWQLLTEHRCRRPLRQNKVEPANNVITQSLHIGVHSLEQQRILGIVDIALAERGT
ncbi:Hypothetical predicted protein [Xyrichtys novacula]|uniref:Uncharacterized protein n=1 Tax=Xyrichtys novacula TaxID=13765 RepID=A0AAV1FED5_XYRNO|nr:Hypothetical predicted protein [Xyrichtys novacula]